MAFHRHASFSPKGDQVVTVGQDKQVLLSSTGLEALLGQGVRLLEAQPGFDVKQRLGQEYAAFLLR